MQYAEALDWLYGRQQLGIKLGLDKVRELLQALGNPHSFPVVHIAGTNGKGSVARYVHRILQHAGYKTGLTTSPHLHDFSERIVIDQPISEEEVVALVQKLQPICKALDADDKAPTFFELVCAMAWLHFQDVDIAVVETGLGGRLDATNVLDSAVTVITNVSLDHQAFLGDDLASITMEKAGIMKQGVPLVTGCKDGSLMALKSESQRLQVPMSILGEDYHILPETDGMQLVTPTGTAHFTLQGGQVQQENAALAVATIHALRTKGFEIGDDAVLQGLQETTHPGRLEHIGEDPAFLLDGAHNVAGAHALRQHLGQLDWGGFHLIVGVASDKDWQEMLAQWIPLACHVHAVPVPNDRSLDPEEIATFSSGFGIPCTTYQAASDALAHVSGKVVVAGSLFVVAGIRAQLLNLEGPRGNQ